MPSFKRAARSAVAVGVLTWTSMAGAVPVATADPSLRAVAQSDAFVDAVGVDTHFNYTNSPYVSEWPALSEALVRSGIRHIRDGGKPEPQYLARLAYLGQHGIKHGVGASIRADAAEIDAHISAYAPYVDYVEGPNEYDSQRNVDPDWAGRVAAFQKLLYETVRANPANAGIKVIGPPLERTELYSDLGVLDQYEDAGNLHTGTCDLNPGTSDPRRKIAYTHTMLRTSTVSKPIWTTEVGFGDDLTRGCAVADDTIAKYIPRTLAEKWNAGEDRIYFYQYATMPTDKVFGSTGLMRADGSPKPQFTALVSLVHLLADPGAPFVPKPLDVALGGNTNDVHSTLLQRRNGSYELLLWLEVRSWDSARHEAIAVPPQSVTVSLPARIASANVYTYTPQWTLAATPVGVRGGTVRLEVRDSISVLTFGP